MDYKTFKNLELEKKTEIYNQWLYESNLEQYELYPNDDEGIELCLERNICPMSSNVYIVDELTHSTHYDTNDKLIMYDRDILYGFKSLTDNEIECYFSQNNFLDWLDGQRLGDHDVI